VIHPARVWIPDDRPGPGTLTEIDLDVEIIDERTLRADGLTVTERRVGPLFEDGDLRFDSAAGGGPLVPWAEDLQARAFGVVNTAFHAQRGLRMLSELLGAPLPPLVVKTGTHAGTAWGGGHYRLPAPSYTDLPEDEPVRSSGEIHLGVGCSFARYGGGLYFHAPTHDAAIIYHELGHHLCRHSADFRLNQRRDPEEQTNHRTPLDEGTADFVAAVLRGTPDIYGWHRGHVPRTQQRRRCLDGCWTMADYHGGSLRDPHTDGTVWASALWAARTALESRGYQGPLFDGVVVRALVQLGRTDRELSEVCLRRRRYFSRALEAVLGVAGEQGDEFVGVVAGAFAAKGIEVGLSNRALRRQARKSARASAALALAR
jgi:hypothetical protein